MDSALIVRRARVATAGVSRSEVARWLDRVPVESLGLAADELFYIPRLAIRLPSGDRISGERVSDRILQSLRRLLESAAYGPDAGFAPGRPYRFTSRSRYLAWLVSLWVGNGSVEARAAFHAATGDASFVHWQRTLLLRDGTSLVTTIARLAESGCAAAWIGRFESADFTLACRALEERFAIRLAPLPEPPSGRPGQAAVFGEALSTAAQVTARDLALHLESRGNHVAHLSAPGRILLLTAVALMRSPSRSPVRIAALIESITAFATAEADAPSPPEPSRWRPTSDAPAPPAIAGRGGASLRVSPPASSGRPETPRDAPIFPDRRDQTPHRDGADEEAPISAAFDAGSDTETDADEPACAAVARPTPRRAPPVPFVLPDAQFATGFGGLLFLLNAFVALGLYPDFTAPLGARLDPSPLWLADRIGRHWFGAPWRRDPLAAWIAEHSASGRLPRAWHAEPDWLTDFATAAAPRRTRRHRHITLWHPAGFPLADAREGQRLRSSHRFRRPQNGRASLARRLPSDPTDRWAACLAHYLDARLRLLCGDGLSLLARPARIRIRDLDLTATFALDRHPIGLRIAGLDRDPGWSPAEGRAIAFVFE